MVDGDNFRDIILGRSIKNDLNVFGVHVIFNYVIPTPV